MISRRRALMLGTAWLGAGFPALAKSPCLAAEDTALDRYVALPDRNYRYDLIDTIVGDGCTGYVLEMTSQQWRSADEIDRPIWTHWLTIIEPREVKTRTGVLVISGGSNRSKPPGRINPLAALLATTTGSVISELRMVPNQPLTFAGETRQRSEDAITAYSWDKFLRTGDDGWPLRLPMTKSAVRAMDTITAFCGSAQGGSLVVDRFVVAGASKRGWTAWTTAAVDKRVVAVVPVVIDLLNIEPSFDHHYRAYGNWAPAVHEYEEMGIMDRAHTPQFRTLMQIEDPYSYRDRVTMPKFIVNSTGDEFFLPDSSQFYFDGLLGEKYLRYVPNTDHSLRDKAIDAGESVLAFYESILSGASRPEFSWRYEDDGSIRAGRRRRRQRFGCGKRRTRRPAIFA
ncbi:PhoPQ-activated pathogenicity-related protein [Rhizobiales bacterium GAS191]|nr:PhoPQ-activated pathogenicity-related protein [Rhizobiales bacterium GAS191]